MEMKIERSTYLVTLLVTIAQVETEMHSLELRTITIKSYITWGVKRKPSPDHLHCRIALTSSWQLSDQQCFLVFTFLEQSLNIPSLSDENKHQLTLRQKESYHYNKKGKPLVPDGVPTGICYITKIMLTPVQSWYIKVYAIRYCWTLVITLLWSSGWITTNPHSNSQKCGGKLSQRSGS